MHSFEDGSMIVPDDELPSVGENVRKVRVEAKKAGVWIFSAGLLTQAPSVVDTNGRVTNDPYPKTKKHLGGFVIVKVASREEALKWAAKVASACRCSQEVFELAVVPTEE